MPTHRPVMLVILDGWGWREETADNAVLQAHTPTFDRLWATCPHALLHTSGKDVGLPPGQMGNSEVGHLNIGAGRVVMQELPRIDHAIESGELAKNPGARPVHRKAEAERRHLSPDGARVARRRALAPEPRRRAREDSVSRPASRLPSTPSWTAATRRRARVRSTWRASLRTCRRRCASRPSPAATTRWIATIAGSACRRPTGRSSKARARAFADPAAAIADAYSKDVTDEFILPAVIGGYQGMRDGDGVLCFNFRADRVRELLAAILDPTFSGFPRTRTVKIAAAVGMTEYSEELNAFLQALFPPQSLSNILGEVVARAGRTQLRMAETEKYPHVTYFLNGGREENYPGEDRIMVPSPKVATYDLQPEMSAPELTDKAVAAIDSRQVRPDRAQLRQSRHGRPHRQPAAPRSRRSKRSTRASARSRTRSSARTARCWSPPITAIAS